MGDEMGTAELFTLDRVGAAGGAEAAVNGFSRVHPMITEEMLRIYEKFNGDIDGFARGSNRAERFAITSEDWHLIEEFLQNLSIIQADFATADFERRVHERIIECTENKSASERLMQLANAKR